MLVVILKTFQNNFVLIFHQKVGATILDPEMLEQWFPTFFDPFLRLFILEHFIPPLLHKTFFHSSLITPLCRNI